MTERSGARDLREELTLASDAELCEMIGCSQWSLNQWRKNLGFPKPVFIVDGSPRRTPLGRVKRWLDSRERRRRRVVPRGKLRRGAE